MSFYWRIDDIPELGALPPPQRRARWREACTQARPRDDAAMAALGAAGAFAVAYVIAVVIGPYAWLADLVVAALVGMAAAVLVRRWRTQPRARRWLREHGDDHA